MSFEIDISNSQRFVPVDIDVLRHAIECTLEIEQVAAPAPSASIVDNDAIHAINRQHLQHDYPTDVISFQLEFGFGDSPFDEQENGCADSLRAAGAKIEGEIVASAQMASDMASTGQWTIMNELTLYVIHGLLHICGYDDLSPEDKSLMRSHERAVLQNLGLKPVYPDDTWSGSTRC